MRKVMKNIIRDALMLWAVLTIEIVVCALIFAILISTGVSEYTSLIIVTVLAVGLVIAGEVFLIVRRRRRDEPVHRR